MRLALLLLFFASLAWASDESLLFRHTYRPPNYESKIEYFNEPFTPNDQFFVRNHLANIPDVDRATWKLEIGGESVLHPFSISFDELKALPQTELAARLPDGPGKDRVIGNCITCHSLDYIQENAFLSSDGWKAEVAKMRDKMGAPISDSDASIILEYLGNFSGKIRPPVLKTEPNERK